MNAIITPPDTSEYFHYYGNYINRVKTNNLINALQENENDFISLSKTIPEQKANYKYADGKWTVKEVIRHLSDAERIFAYRALTFARNDKNPLPGFEENDYVPESNCANQTLSEIAEEWVSVRAATIALFKSFTSEMSLRKGLANGKEISVRALGFVIVGHTVHHAEVIRERYL